MEAELQEETTGRNEADPGDNAQGSLLSLHSAPLVGHVQQKPAGRSTWENNLYSHVFCGTKRVGKGHRRNMKSSTSVKTSGHEEGPTEQTAKRQPEFVKGKPC